MKKFLFSLVFLFLLFSSFPKPALADEIKSFDTKITAHKNGVMDIKETIVYVFDSYHHGIYRYIPRFAKVGNLYRVSDIKFNYIQRDGKKEQYSTSQTNEDVQVKIGDPDKRILGEHIYQIDYSVVNGIGSNFPDHDEIYWNTTGNDWPDVIQKATAAVITDFVATSTASICFTGVVGTHEKNCVAQNGVFTSTKAFYSGEGMTIVEAYPSGTFPKSVLQNSPPQTFGEHLLKLFLKYIHIIYFLLNIVLPLYLIYWYQKHKNKKRFGVPPVNFDIPKDENGTRIIPAMAGTIDTARLERDDVTATIFDLAIRKYLRLEEEKSPKILGIIGKEAKQKIIKLKGKDKNLTAFESILYDRLFRGGDEIYVKDLKTDFYKTFAALETQIFADLVSKGYYAKNPKNQKALLIILGIFVLFTFNIVLAIVLFWLARKLNGRTSLGDEIDNKIDGLKLFLKSMDRNYKWQAEKFYTVEQMIPYAMALGYIDQFMKQLKIMKPDYNPSWYWGYSGNFYSGYSGFYAGFSSSVTTSAPSSSSGFSGGSSGGGGGGGGGGSW